jgi:sugar lactone lactonase YvrE
VSTPPPVPATAALSIPAHTKRENIRARMTIKVPRKKSGKRGVRYISPGTESIAISIYDATHTTLVTTANQNITSGSPGCTTPTPISPLTCQISFSVPAGSYTADFVTYNGVLDGSGNPQGSKLSANVDFPFSIIAGASNNVSATLGGIPASLIVAPVAPGYLRGDKTALRLWGPSSQEVFIAALDASGAAIIGTGAPQLTVTSGSTTLGVTAATSAAPNIFLLQASATGSPPVVTPGRVILSVTATPASSTGSVSPAIASVPVTIAHSAVYVSLVSPNDVEVFYDGNTGSPTPIAVGVTVRGLAVDSNGTLYVANPANNGVSEYRAGTTTPSATLSGSGMSGPMALGTDANGRLYVTNNTANTVTEYVRDSTTAATTLNDSSIDGPLGIAVDSSGTVYVANSTGNTVTEYAAGATTPGVTLTASPGDISAPHGVAVDANGTLYVANNTTNIVAEFQPGMSAPSVQLTGLSGPYGVSVDAADTLYVVNETAKTVAEYANGMSSPTVTIPITAGTPLYVAAFPGSVVP